MNSRERVLAALNHIEPDMVPLDLGGNQSGIHIIAYRRLLDFLDIEDSKICFNDFAQQSVKPCEELLQRFDTDVRWLHPQSAIIPIDYIPKVEGKFQGKWDQFGVFWGNNAEKPVKEVLYYDPVIHPLSEMKTVQEIKNYDWPDGTDPTPFKGLREQARKLRESTDYAIATPPVGCIYEYTTFLFGFKTALHHMQRKPDLIKAAMEELERYWTDYATAFLNEVKFGDEHYVDILANNGDLAQQTGPIMSPKRIYEPLIKPIEKRFSETLHSLAEIKINYHSCGSVPHFIPHFAEIGYDAVNPIQIGATDMEPCSLKERFGKMITFWGGLCDTQKTLPFGTPEEIRREVEYNMNCLKPGGGYIASNIHNITAEVPPVNIVAMFDAAREFRSY
ncbi:MAG: uroporphyrinogen decarboxylase family protein [Candidatus Thorarchaeota archaeon]|nr:uroporphyrinogen decarboxylase family protein [Candidatus Thorarchaeota archaeon]